MSDGEANHSGVTLLDHTNDLDRGFHVLRVSSHGKGLGATQLARRLLTPADAMNREPIDVVPLDVNILTVPDASNPIANGHLELLVVLAHENTLPCEVNRRTDISEAFQRRLHPVIALALLLEAHGFTNRKQALELALHEHAGLDPHPEEIEGLLAVQICSRREQTAQINDALVVGVELRVLDRLVVDHKKILPC